MKKILIKTKRFILRPLSTKDVNETYLNWFNDKENVGISAGASTPDYLIDEVTERIKIYDKELSNG